MENDTQTQSEHPIHQAIKGDASRQALLETQQRIQPFIHRTPILSSRQINQLAGVEIHFKCDNFQKGGSFKMRGAANAIHSLSAEEKAKGVVTHSSGNFAQAVSLAAQSLGVSAYIVMPDSAPAVKQAAVKGYGGQVSICPSTLADREAYSQRIIDEKGATFLHPSNQIEVILGQATAGMELLEDHPDLDVILAPVGGGGLIAGTCLAAHHFGQNCEVIGGEPFEVDDAYRSLQSGSIQTNETANTIADGLRTQLGDVNFPIIQQHLSRIIRVEEAEIVAAMRLVWERMKIIIEPSCAVPLAALLREKEAFAGKKVGIIITGGNVDLGKLPF
ncbi:MAG: threonine/serine dehydratase [Bacteroidota bacterium]